MSRAELRVWTPTIHPFTREGVFDEAGFRVLLRRLVEAGVDLYLPNEGQGECNALSWSETRRVMEVAKEEAKGRVQVWGMWRQARTAAEQIAFIELCQEVGVDGILVYGLEIGHAIFPTEREQEAYLRQVLAAGRIPMQVEVLTYAGYQYSVALLRRIADDFPKVSSLMLATHDQRYIREVQRELGGRLAIHVPAGDLFAHLTLGITGFAFTYANLVPRSCVRILDLYRAGQYLEMQALAVRVQEIGERIHGFNGTRDTGRSEAVKAALSALGLPGGYPRPPRLPVPEERLPELARVVQELRIEELETVPPRAGR